MAHSVIRSGQYVIADSLMPGDVEVPQRPQIYSAWSGSEWTFDRDKWLNAEIRPQRNELLNKTDVYMFLDKWGQLTADQQTELLTYRQSLRDVPETISYDNPVWPAEPSFII